MLTVKLLADTLILCPILHRPVDQHHYPFFFRRLRFLPGLLWAARRFL